MKIKEYLEKIGGVWAYDVWMYDGDEVFELFEGAIDNAYMNMESGSSITIAPARRAGPNEDFAPSIARYLFRRMVDSYSHLDYRTAKAEYGEPFEKIALAFSKKAISIWEELDIAGWEADDSQPSLEITIEDVLLYLDSDM